MIFDKLNAQNDILGVSLQASMVRNDVYTNNIANNDVPGFKAKDVKFEQALQKAINNKKRTGKLNLSDVKATVYVLHDRFNYRVDKNNVDIETEMVKLYQNSVKFDTMVSGIQNNSKCLNLALTGR